MRIPGAKWIPGATQRAKRRELDRQREALRQQLRDQMRIRAEVEQELRASTQGGGGSRRSRWRTVRGLVWRGRRVLSPFAVLAVLGLLGVAATYAAPAPAAFPGLWLLTVAGWWLLRGRRGVDTGRERVYTAACVAGGLGWLVAAQVAGVWSVDQWLVLGWFAVSMPWWVRHWPGDRGPATAAVVEAVEESTDTIVDRWNTNVAAPMRALTGATLSHPTITEHGEAYKGQAVPGAPGHTLQEIRGKHPQIAHGLLEPMERIVIDQDPDSEDPSRFRLQVIHRSPIEKPVYFEEPRWDGGKIVLGPYADGVGDAVWRLYSDDSMWGGFILGSSGSGKSRLLESLAITARAMSAAGQPTAIIYLDGQDGASSPLLWEHATLSGGPGESHLVLDALERELRRRQLWNRLHKLAGFSPGVSPDGEAPGMPGLLVALDEQHGLINPHNALRWANIAREGRKVGIAVIGADQYCDLEVFGGKEALRSSLLAGNGLALRTLSTQAGNLVPGLSLDPSTFPDLPGYGYKIAAQGSRERTAPFRARFLPADKDRERLGVLPVPTVADWFERTSDADLGEATARTFGDVYLRRAELAADAEAAARIVIETGVLPEPPPEPAGPALAAVEQSDTPDEARTTRDQILALLRKHAELPPVKLQEMSGKSKSSVRDQLRALLEEGLIQRGADGYSLVRDAVSAA